MTAKRAGRRATSEKRVDLALVERGLAESRAQAQRLVMAGQVRVAGQVVLKSSRLVADSETIEVDHGPRYVSRGGEKLEAALEAFALDVEGMTCADVGASTGGFTDCLLQRGARRVYAIDVGRGILHWKLRSDDRVISLEGTNARYLEGLPEPVQLATVDAAFISLELLLPRVAGWLTPAGNVVVLVKPQFEAGKNDVPRDGVVRDPMIHRAVLVRIVRATAALGLAPQGLVRSPLLGPKGNAEFLLWAKRGGTPRDLVDEIEASVSG